MFTSCMSMLVAFCVFTNLKSRGFVSEAIVTGSDQLGKIIEAAGETGQSVDELQRSLRRRKRTIITHATSAAQKATRAVENVLSDATKLRKRSRCCDDFQKFGGYRDAVRDFNNLELEYVNRFTLPRGVMGKSGEIGDRTVFVRSSGTDGRPVLEIIKRQEYMEMKDSLEWMSTEPPIIRIFYSKISVEK